MWARSTGVNWGELGIKKDSFKIPGVRIFIIKLDYGE
jgi:hypothetical protein